MQVLRWLLEGQPRQQPCGPVDGPLGGQTAQLSLQLILDEPPERLWQQWIKDRMEYYLRVEPVDAIRDEALDHSYPVEERIRFSIRNGLGTVSDLIWGILLSNPERDGLYQIQKLAAKKVKPQ